MGSDRCGEALDVLLDPGSEVGEGQAGVGAQGREAVFDAQRHLGVDLAVHEAMVFQAAQGLGEDLGADSLKAGAQGTEALRPLLERSEGERTPLVGEEVEHVVI